MVFSDLIDEIIESAGDGVLGEIKKTGKYGLKVFEAEINSTMLENKYKKAQGRYQTINISPIFHFNQSAQKLLTKYLVEALGSFFADLTKSQPRVLVVGLGNAFIMSDSIGARVVRDLFATHNLPAEVRAGFGDMACLIPGVSGQNGINTFDLVKSAVAVVEPDVVLIIDALTARNYERLGCSFQLSDTSMTPGAGVGGKNRVLNKCTLGQAVISIGVPMMINARNFADLDDLPDIVLTPKEIDIYTHTCSRVLSRAINTVVHGAKIKDFA